MDFFLTFKTTPFLNIAGMCILDKKQKRGFPPAYGFCSLISNYDKRDEGIAEC